MTIGKLTVNLQIQHSKQRYKLICTWGIGCSLFPNQITSRSYQLTFHSCCTYIFAKLVKMDWQVQFIVALMSIVYITAVTSYSDSSAYSFQTESELKAQQLYGQRHDGVGVKMFNVNDSLKSYPHRRSYSAAISAALNGLRDYTGLQHISSSYMPIPKAVTSTSSSDNLDGNRAIETKQQIPIYEEQPDQPDHDYTAAGVSGTSSYTQPEFHRENNQHSGNDALSTAIYNLNAASAHSNYYGGSTTNSNWPTAWSQTDDFQHFLAANDNDKSKVNSFQYPYEYNTDYEAPPTHHNQAQNTQQQYFSAQLFKPYFTPHTAPESAENESQYEEPTNYLTKPNEQIDTEAYYKQEQQQQQQQQPEPPDVINYVPYPVVKKLHVPVHQNIQIPVSHAVIMPVRKPVPIHIPVTQQVQVPVEKDLRIPVERIVPYPVEKHIPVPVEKRVPYPVVRYVPVKVPRPYAIKVPIYKTVLHKMKSLW